MWNLFKKKAKPTPVKSLKEQLDERRALPRQWELKIRYKRSIFVDGQLAEYLIEHIELFNTKWELNSYVDHMQYYRDDALLNLVDSNELNPDDTAPIFIKYKDLINFDARKLST